MDCNGLAAGQVIEEPYVKTEAGLELSIKSASPFAIGWNRIEPVSDDNKNESQENTGSSTTPAKTGDSMGNTLWIWITVLVLAVACMAVFVGVKLRGKGKDGNKTE